jgi:hypothetical protein
MKIKRTDKTARTTAVKVGRALRRAAKDARRTARTHGVPIYVWENGKVVALRLSGDARGFPPRQVDK